MREPFDLEPKQPSRLRGLGVAWQPEERRWSLSDPLLASWVRENAPSWALRRSHSG